MEIGRWESARRREEIRSFEGGALISFIAQDDCSGLWESPVRLMPARLSSCCIRTGCALPDPTPEDPKTRYSEQCASLQSFPRCARSLNAQPLLLASKQE
jgi:hypothetical protein